MDELHLERKQDTNPNASAQDAYARMDVARWGSLRTNSMEYLYTLQREVKEWLCEIEFDIRRNEENG